MTTWDEADPRLIIAVDDIDPTSLLNLLHETRPYCKLYKFGAVAFSNGYFSSQLAEWCRVFDMDIMVDNKYHDIPNTVRLAVRSLLRVNHHVKFITVHAAGGKAMIAAAKEEASVIADTKILAITMLTSLDNEDLTNMGYPPGTDLRDLVYILARGAVSFGADGVVCSARELGDLQGLHPGKIFVTPGIQLKIKNVDQNQTRVTSPRIALDDGADYIVVGREITTASDRRVAAKRVVDNMRGLDGTS
jgi:orotidine-5'-phosphate decarboxylase